MSVWLLAIAVTSVLLGLSFEQTVLVSAESNYELIISSGTANPDSGGERTVRLTL